LPDSPARFRFNHAVVTPAREIIARHWTSSSRGEASCSTCKHGSRRIARSAEALDLDDRQPQGARAARPRFAHSRERVSPRHARSRGSRRARRTDAVTPVEPRARVPEPTTPSARSTSLEASPPSIRARAARVSYLGLAYARARVATPRRIARSCSPARTSIATQENRRST
jgi:hypothetical protein